MSVSGAMAAIASALASVNSSEDEELAWYVWAILGVGIGLGIVALFWWGSR